MNKIDEAIERAATELSDMTIYSGTARGIIGKILHKYLDPVLAAETTTVVVRVHQGCVQDVQAPKGLIVEIRDYDAEGELSDLIKDEKGETYISRTWENTDE